MVSPLRAVRDCTGRPSRPWSCELSNHQLSHRFRKKDDLWLLRLVFMVAFRCLNFYDSKHWRHARVSHTQTHAGSSLPIRHPRVTQSSVFPREHINFPLLSPSSSSPLPGQIFTTLKTTPHFSSSVACFSFNRFSRWTVRDVILMRLFYSKERKTDFPIW